MKISSLAVGPLQSNCYVIWDEETKYAAIIDPGDEPQKIKMEIESQGLIPKIMFITHGHIDHIAGAAGLKKAYPAIEVMGHKEDADMMLDPVKNLGIMMGLDVRGPAFEKLLEDGDTITLGKTKLNVLHVPGHSPGSICLYYKGTGKGQSTLFAGDVIFYLGIGRTDFPGGSFELLIDGIRKKIFTLPPDTVIYPGHGNDTTVKFEKASNPFLDEDRM